MVRSFYSSCSVDQVLVDGLKVMNGLARLLCFALLWEGWLCRLLFQACASTSGWILGLIGRFSYVSQSNLMGMV